MSKDKTLFEVLPNEIIYCVFEFLPTIDIVRAFLPLNQRYRDVVRSCVKQIDLTDDWQGHHSALQQICDTAETIKVDRYALRLFSNYRFPQLHSLTLVNVNEWNKLLHGLDLRSLTVDFDNDEDDSRTFENDKPLPSSLSQFALKGSLSSRCYHANLLRLNIYVLSMVNLLQILQETPNVHYLSVHFIHIFSRYYQQTADLNRLETMTANFSRLANLNALAFATKNDTRTLSNERFPFEQLQFFMDRCCPNERILKKFSLNLHRIFFTEEFWSKVKQYKSIYQSFNLYASLIIINNLQQVNDRVQSDEAFAFHLENGTLNWNQPPIHTMHIYSLPFVSRQLHGFTSCTALSSRCSYSTVRHLYCTKDPCHQSVSFQSLSKRMPHLLSIQFDSGTWRNCSNGPLPSVDDDDDDVLSSVRTLCFKWNCSKCRCFSYKQLSQLLARMPNLKNLITLDSTLPRIQHPLKSIRKLHLYGCNDAVADIISRATPYVSIIMFTDLSRYVRERLGSSVRTLFSTLARLTVVSLQVYSDRRNYQTPFKRLAERILKQAQTTHQQFEALRLTFEEGRMEFSFPSAT